MQEGIRRDVPNNYKQSVIIPCNDVLDLSSALENGSGAFEGERESNMDRPSEMSGNDFG